ncbi:hypothetical protein ACF0H5_011441 [Mactra antiquata]
MRLLAVFICGLCLVHVRSETDEELYEDIRILEEIKERLNEVDADQRRIAAGSQDSRLDQVSQVLNDATEAQDEAAALKAEEQKHRTEVVVDKPSEFALDWYIFYKKPCCEPGMAFIDLRNQRKFSTLRDVPESGITITSQNTQESECSNMAHLKIKFDTLGGGDYCCVKTPRCGRKMLKILLELDDRKRRDGHMFNVGDSPSNDGYAGDAGHQYCDAEVYGIHPSVAVYTNDYGGATHLSTFANVLRNANKYVTLYVSNEFVRIKSDIGTTRSLCNEYLFCLNGQPDLNVNQDIYIGLNRVIRSTMRNGFGVCSATITWECPCVNDWNRW